MKKFLDTRFGEAIILIASSLVNLLFTVAYFSTSLTDYWIDYYFYDVNLWTCEQLFIGQNILNGFNLILIAALLIGLALSIIGSVMALVKNKRKTFYVSFGYNIALSLTVLIINVPSQMLRSGAIICAVLSAIVSGAALIFMIMRKNSKVEIDASAEREISPAKAKSLRIGMLACEIVAMVISFSLFVFPLYSYYQFDNYNSTYFLIDAVANNRNGAPIQISIGFIVMFFACLASVFSFVSSISFLGRSNNVFAKKSQNYMYFATFVSVLFFVLGFCFTFYLNLSLKGEDSNYSVTTVSYIPAIIVMATLVAYSVMHGRLASATDIAETRDENVKQFKFEPLIYVFVLTAITFASLALVLIDVQVSYFGYTAYSLHLTGYQLLSTYKDLDAEFQTVAFAFVVILVTSSILLVLSVTSYFTKSKNYYSLAKVSAFGNFVFMLMVGLFGLYYQIAQKVNIEHILNLIKQLNGLEFIPEDYVEGISTQSYIALIASLLVLLFMFFRKQFNLTAEADENGIGRKGRKPRAAQPVAQNGSLPALDESAALANFDACPAFTELDGKIPQFEEELETKKQSLFTSLTLPNLVRFVVDYARESRLHLSYSLEDIATFVAGLGASRLSILQGMSGTGKTSLPKIFTEAIMGNCEIVEVESSWRDKNELLGYYNEFSKCFTPKKFTQSLYKARLNSSVPTFIVLDEMNLSRIEYYFSDFLSLMENEEHKREIKLLNIKLFRHEDGELVPYCGLTDGHTIKIPANVWFIGTANRDESTFEISDKVYDRAQTMNFNKRAPKVHSFSEPLPQRFASYDMLNALFDEAKRDYVFEAEDNAIIQKVEKILLPYNISFGNRILKQMEDFVKIYCTCFGDKSAAESDAVEKILLSKVVSKLENKIVENKDALAAEFNKLGLSRCSAFIQKLNED